MGGDARRRRRRRAASANPSPESPPPLESVDRRYADNRSISTSPSSYGLIIAHELHLYTLKEISMHDTLGAVFFSWGTINLKKKSPRKKKYKLEKIMRFGGKDVPLNIFKRRNCERVGKL